MRLDTTVISLKYAMFNLKYDIRSKTACRWDYMLDKKDAGDAKRPIGYYFDPGLDTTFQQHTTRSYGRSDGVSFDRGHLARSADFTKNAFVRRQAHYITNILPQVSTFNQGIWLQTERIATFASNTNRVSIFGGVVFDSSSKEYFLESHGVLVPSFFYKILVANGKCISWYIPNGSNLSKLGVYITSVNEIERETNENFDIEPGLKDVKAGDNWEN